LQPKALITIYVPRIEGKNHCMRILPFSACGALTSCRCADKNAHFLRQAVSFASRNGRSANPSLKDKLLKEQLF
jgi:hypothetical protein